MTATITIDSAGRFVLPKAMRDQLHLTAGSRLKADLVADKIELTPEPATNVKLVKRGKLTVISGSRPVGQVAEALREDREERMAQIADGLRSP